MKDLVVVVGILLVWVVPASCIVWMINTHHTPLSLFLQRRRDRRKGFACDKHRPVKGKIALYDPSRCPQCKKELTKAVRKG